MTEGNGIDANEYRPVKLMSDELRLLHELQVHKVELEEQNAALREARSIAEQATERYIELFDLAPMAYFTLAQDGVIKNLNLRAADLLGMDRAKMLGKNFNQYICGNDLAIFKRFFENVFSSDAAQNCEIKLRCAGTDCWGVVEASADGLGKTCLVSVCDITERKRNEELLRNSNAFTLAVLNSLSAQIAVLDAQGVIIAVNDAWIKFAKDNGLPESKLNMVGFNYLHACQDSFNQFVSEDAESAHSGISEVLAGKRESFSLEYTYHSPDQLRWFRMRVTRLKGACNGAVVSHEDTTKQKQADQVFIQLKALLDISTDGFCILDDRGNLLLTNQAYANISGFSIAELQRMNIGQLEAIKTPEQISAHMASVVKLGFDQFETRHFHRDGHLIDIDVSVAYLREFRQFCAFYRDISERKALINEIKANEKKFRSIIEHTPVPMILNDENQNVTFLNPAFVQTFGYTGEDIPTLKDWWSKAYPDHEYRSWVIKAWGDAQEKAFRQQTGFPPLELEIRCKNNSHRTVLATDAAVQHDFSGEHLAILYDITPRIQTEAKLNSIFNAAVDGIITYDVSKTIVSANAAVETIFGYQPTELTGCNFLELVPSFPKTMLDCCCSAVAEKPIAQILEIEGMHKNGAIIPLEISRAAYSIDEECFFTAIIRDVSLRKQRAKLDKQHLDELAHVTRLGLMGEMASGIAHEVNQPLTAIASYVQAGINFIQSGKADEYKLLEILVKAQQQALRAGQIIHRMREFIQHKPKKRSTLFINSLIQECINICMPDIRQNGIEINHKLDLDLPAVHSDHIQIEQVLINLIRNAIEAMQCLPADRPRNLSIHAGLSGDREILVRVKDNGKGIEPEQQPRIMMPFFTTKAEGMGMGLSISRSLVEAHGGSLFFNSKPGKGSSFYFTLPVQCQASDLNSD